MKRKEMVGRIFDIIEPYLVAGASDQRIMIIADLILMTCEQSGMLPPSKYQLSFSEGLFEWEQENENG